MPCPPPHHVFVRWVFSKATAVPHPHLHPRDLLLKDLLASEETPHAKHNGVGVHSSDPCQCNGEKLHGDKWSDLPLPQGVYLGQHCTAGTPAKELSSCHRRVLMRNLRMLWRTATLGGASSREARKALVGALDSEGSDRLNALAPSMSLHLA
eukprot:Sspe_Gene.72136::Locus_42950_Transcript_1_1_Confidence_1.000_Length_2047::g.72136::m.72136